MTANETATSQPKKSRVLLWVGLGCSSLFLCLLVCVGVYFFFIRGANGAPANTDTIQRITVAFVSALQDKKYSVAQSMFSDENRDSITIEALEILANESSIVTYQQLTVCEFNVFFGQSGKQLSGTGLLRYEGGLIAFESTLLQNPDGAWQMYGFFLQPNVDPTPWGACKYEQP
ncbi:MAG: hypothetical protein HY863_00055 [Chloroflexi bacterium]|nr:hypothetical protein [Chloroflexota bacterium]